MGITCSRCFSSNSKRSAFCSLCGNKLFLNRQAGQFLSNFNSRSQVNTPSPFSLPQQPMSFTVPVMHQRPLSNNLTPIPVSFSSDKVTTDQKALSMRHVLTSRGCLTTHYSWLLEGKHTQAFLVRSATLSMFRQHTLSGLRVNTEKIWEQGFFEEREYITVQRGSSTIFIYIAPTGRDLYISRTTMVSPKISSTKIAIGSVLLLFLTIGSMLLHSMHLLVYGSHLYNNSSLYNTLLVSSTARFIIPLFTLSLLFLCMLICIRSCIYWFVEKDFWSLLRFNHLNAFQVDDIAFLEQTADSIIHNAVKQLGLDATTITPPPLGYQHEHKIRSVASQLR